MAQRYSQGPRGQYRMAAEYVIRETQIMEAARVEARVVKALRQGGLPA
jgi:hypothetical protein